MSEREKYVGVDEIAAWLGVKPVTVREWARTGVITGHQPGGRVWLFRESEVEASINGSDRKPVEQPAAPQKRSRPVAFVDQPVTSIRERIRERIRRSELGTATPSRPPSASSRQGAGK